jgi:putative transposase
MVKSTRRTRRAFARIGTGTSLCLRYRMPRTAERMPGAELSRDAKQRLRWMDYARTHSVSATCRHFGIARSTYYRWATRYDPQRLSFLENRSSAPRRMRRPTWTADQAQAVRQARNSPPRWGKDKLAVVLRRDGAALSVSMIGRILADLNRRGVLIEPKAARLRPHSRHPRPYATRKPKEYAATAPGDLVQVDTMHLIPLPGVERRQFTAVDFVSRLGVLGVRSCATAGTARDFLAELDARMPFPVKAIQVDGGSEFMAEFEAACAAQNIALFVLPPRSPKLNGRVERLNGTSRREFWELYDDDLELPPLQAALREWEHTYNQVRPHQALGYRTPAEHLAALATPPVAEVPNEDKTCTYTWFVRILGPWIRRSTPRGAAVSFEAGLSGAVEAQRGAHEHGTTRPCAIPGKSRGRNPGG